MNTTPTEPPAATRAATEAGVCLVIAPLLIIAGGVALFAPRGAHAQGTFQNLDFESAVVPSLPPGQTQFIPFTNAFPGWNAVTNPGAVALYNGISIGAAMLSIIDGHTAGYSNDIIGGYFTAVLQSGNVSPPQTYGPASLFQAGLIPIAARSLLFSASGFAGYNTNFFLAIDGQNVGFSAISAGTNFTTYGADISAFAGQTAEVRFTAQPGANGPFTTVFLDDIKFSDLSIPEPSGMALLVMGAAMAGYRFVVRRR